VVVIGEEQVEDLADPEAAEMQHQDTQVQNHLLAQEVLEEMAKAVAEDREELQDLADLVLL
jgi:hypothetical protein